MLETVTVQVYTIVDKDTKGVWVLSMPPRGMSRSGGFHTHMKVNFDGYLRGLGMRGDRITDWHDPRGNCEYTLPKYRFEQLKKMYC